MNIIPTYVKNQLTNSGHYRLTSADEYVIRNKGIEEFIYTKLTSKKFRKWKILPECEARTRTAIHTKVSKSQPLVIVYPQGGYKLWRLPSAPEIDWAEFFNLSYVLQYIAPLAAAYDKGVNLTYYMHTLLMELHDNLTTEEIDRYVYSFQKLVAHFQTYLPKNIKISILKDADLYTREEYFERVEKGKVKAEKDYNGFSDEKREKYLRMSKLNIKWKGKEDWTSLSEFQKEEKYKQSALYELSAVYNLQKTYEKVKSPENILVFAMSSNEFIGIGSTRTSIAKHWVGYGVLEQEGDEFYARILTPSQLAEAKHLPHTSEQMDILNLRNLKELLVFPRRFNYRSEKNSSS